MCKLSLTLVKSKMLENCHMLYATFMHLGKVGCTNCEKCKKKIPCCVWRENLHRRHMGDLESLLCMKLLDGSIMALASLSCPLKTHEKVGYDDDVTAHVSTGASTSLRVYTFYGNCVSRTLQPCCLYSGRRSAGPHPLHTAEADSERWLGQGQEGPCSVTSLSTFQ